MLTHKNFNVKDLLLKAISIPSFTAEEHEFSQFLAQEIKGCGITDVIVDKWGNVVAIAKFRDPDSRKVAIMANLDTSKPKGKCPESGVVDGKQFGISGDCIVGLGAVAPKASVVAIVATLKNIMRSKEELSGTLIAAFVVRDLMANHDGPAAISDYLKDADFILSAEPTANAIVLSTRGIMQFEIIYEGVPVHRGNADHELNICFALGTLLSLLKSEPVICDDSFGKTGFNPYDITCDASAPLVPKKIKVKIDRRLLPNENSSDVAARLKEMLAISVRDLKNVSSDIKILSMMYPFSALKESAECRLLEKTVVDVTGTESKTIAPKFASNISYFSKKFGVKGLILGPGRIEDIHPIEHIAIKEIECSVEIYSRFVECYMGQASILDARRRIE